MGSIEIIHGRSELVIRDPGYSSFARIFYGMGALCAFSAVIAVLSGEWARRMTEGVPLAGILASAGTGVFALVLVALTALFCWLGWRMRDSGVTATFSADKRTATISGGYYRTVKEIRLGDIHQARVLVDDYRSASVALHVEGEGLVRITGVSSRTGMQKAADEVNRFLGTRE